MSHNGTLYIIAAPSGAGKTSIVDYLTKADPRLRVSVSFTTRPSRPNETDGENYFFRDEATFHEMVDSSAFLEHAKVFDYHYGTSREWVESTLASGDDVILEIDWQGAEQVRTQMPDCVSIFILPPGISILEQRLKHRAQDDERVIKVRMAKAKNEISHYKDFDYLVINDDFAHACADIQSIIRARRLTQARQERLHQSLIKELLSS